MQVDFYNKICAYCTNIVQLRQFHPKTDSYLKKLCFWIEKKKASRIECFTGCFVLKFEVYLVFFRTIALLEGR